MADESRGCFKEGDEMMDSLLQIAKLSVSLMEKLSKHRKASPGSNALTTLHDNSPLRRTSLPNEGFQGSSGSWETAGYANVSLTLPGQGPIACPKCGHSFEPGRTGGAESQKAGGSRAESVRSDRTGTLSINSHRTSLPETPLRDIPGGQQRQQSQEQRLQRTESSIDLRKAPKTCFDPIVVMDRREVYAGSSRFRPSASSSPRRPQAPVQSGPFQPELCQGGPEVGPQCHTEVLRIVREIECALESTQRLIQGSIDNMRLMRDALHNNLNP